MSMAEDQEKEETAPPPVQTPVPEQVPPSEQVLVPPQERGAAWEQAQLQSQPQVLVQESVQERGVALVSRQVKSLVSVGR